MSAIDARKNSPAIYVDTSVLVAYYCPEPMSGLAQARLRDQPMPSLSGLTEVEFASALARKCRRREIGQGAALQIQTAFQQHLSRGLYRRLPMEARHFETARLWIDSLLAPLRSLDALHLALAVDAGLTILSADRRLVAAAHRLGIAAELLAKPSS